jgi:hypothetical protein
MPPASIETATPLKRVSPFCQDLLIDPFCSFHFVPFVPSLAAIGLPKTQITFSPHGKAFAEQNLEALLWSTTLIF